MDRQGGITAQPNPTSPFQTSRPPSYAVEPDDVDDDVFEVADVVPNHSTGGQPTKCNKAISSSVDLKVRKEQISVDTGYPGYVAPTPPCLDEDPAVEDILHKTILVGDSGVGKTSLLVQFDTGTFHPSSFAATVGIGFTVMLLGDSGVGKTCFLLRFTDKTFLSGSFIATVGIDFRNKVLTLDGAKVKLQIWDTAGQERFRSVTHAYYRDAHALFLLYDVTNRRSFDNTRAWLAEINEYAHRDVIIMLLGNKCDSPDRAVDREEGERLAREYHVNFMETSAKTGFNVLSAFTEVARALKDKRTTVADTTSYGSKEYVEPNQWNTKSSCARCNTS